MKTVSFHAPHTPGPTSLFYRTLLRGTCPRRCQHRKSVRVAPCMGPLDALRRAVAGSSVYQQPAGEAFDGQDFGKYQAIVDRVNKLEGELDPLTDDELCARFMRLRARVAKEAVGENLETALDRALEEVFAVVREASFRVLGLRHYDVQILGGIILHKGQIAEMATGEGKTIVALLPAVLNALGGRSVYVVTVNDYLAKRDAELVGQVHKFLGLSVGLIQADMKPASRKEAYGKDITYVTNSELGFDYLRDNLAFTKDDIVMERPFGYCIVDEADSILIDEARTPLIISGRIPAPTQKYITAQNAANVLERDFHYTVSEKEQSVVLTERGFTDLEGALKVKDLYDPRNPWAAFITNALKAKELFKKDVNYIVSESEDSQGEIEIVDEFTGRVLKGRRWSDGLHQAIEAKEGITVANEATTAAKISYQAFFKLFEKLSGMTGTASTEAKELRDIYGLSVVSIPTALPCGRKDYPDVVFKNQSGKLRAIMAEIARVAPTGRPVLIGTTSVESSEALSKLLTEVEVPHEVLNAKPESALRESEIVAQAGRKFSITIATNMAGRGTDILLGGNADYFARAIARRELVRRNDTLFQQLMSSEAPILIDDSALPVDISEDSMTALLQAVDFIVQNSSKSLVESLASIDGLVSVAAEYGPIPEVLAGGDKLRNAIELIRNEIEETSTKEQEEVINLGGLYIIGTERADSRRIDNQLRGRAGRQGDPGGTRFFLALDDRLFTLFGGDKIKRLMDTFRVGDDLPLENKAVSNALDGAQERVEAYFRDIRQQLFEYDEVLATQRTAFYAARRRVLTAARADLFDDFRKDCATTVREIVPNYVDKPDGSPDNFDGLAAKLAQFFNGIQGASAQELQSARVGGIEEHALSCVDDLVLQRRSFLDKERADVMVEATRYIWLTQMDNLWMGHMKAMDYLKEFVVLRSYGSDEPLQVYQIEGFEMFNDMLDNVRRNTVYSLFQYKAETENAPVATGGSSR